MMSTQLFRDKRPPPAKSSAQLVLSGAISSEAPKWQCLEYASLCPGQIFLHIWAEVHKELYKEESFPAQMY